MGWAGGLGGGCQVSRARTQCGRRICLMCGASPVHCDVPSPPSRPVVFAPRPRARPPPPRGPSSQHAHPLPPPPLSCSDRLTELRRLILEEQQNALAPDNLYPSAFVTFKRRTSQASGAAQRRRLQAHAAQHGAVPHSSHAAGHAAVQAERSKHVAARGRHEMSTQGWHEATAGPPYHRLDSAAAASARRWWPPAPCCLRTCPPGAARRPPVPRS